MRAAQAEFRRRDEIPELCAHARLRVGDTVSEVLKWLGLEVPPAFLEYRHAGDRYSSSVTIETISSGRWTS